MAHTDSYNRPRVGIGIIIVNRDGKILIGKRIGSHAPYYSIPGGHLEPGETFEATAKREAKEEHGITLVKPEVMAVTNNLATYRESGRHYISVIVKAGYHGTPKIMEPDKCAEVFWCDPKALPQPHFDASQWAVKCYLNKSFYEGEQ